MRNLITGGAGFIGSTFVRLLAKTKGLSPEGLPAGRQGTAFEFIVVDKLAYAGDLKRLEAKGA